MRLTRRRVTASNPGTELTLVSMVLLISTALLTPTALLTSTALLTLKMTPKPEVQKTPALLSDSTPKIKIPC